ncbi:MAG: redox-sensitive transcriptional activator SoxR [Acidimicrobiales bacterium]
MTDATLTIGEVAARTGVASSALRFYESRRLIAATRTAGGQRRFGRDVIRRVSFIRAAQRVGLTLDEIAAALDGLPGGRTPTRRDWERMSSRWRPWLDARIRAMEALRDQVDSCIGCGCLSLDTCALYNPGDAAAGLGDGPRYLLGDSFGDL